MKNDINFKIKKRERISLTIPEDIIENIKKIAKDNGVSLSHIVSIILKEYFDSEYK